MTGSGFMTQMWANLTITGPQAVSVVLAAAVMYLLYAGLLIVLGPRVFGSVSTASVAMVAVLAALMARSMLGNSPTLLGGLVAVATLVALEEIFGVLRSRIPRRRRRSGQRAILVMAEGKILPKALAVSRVSERDLWTKLRQAGVRDRSELAAVIVEARGGLTILREGETIEGQLLEGVRNVDRLPSRCLAEPGLS